MNKKFKNLLLLILLLTCISLSSCGFNQIFKERIINEVENKHYEYTQNIIVDDIEDALTSGAEIAKASCVGIEVINKNILGEKIGTGSGVIVKRIKQYNGTYDYLVVTNRHVTGINYSTEIKVYLDENSSLKANFVSYDKNADLALISFNSGALLNVATISTEELKCGQFAIAIGCPYSVTNYFNTVTVGSISALNRKHTEENVYGDEVKNTYIQHDAAVNSGNSGGGLFDIYGRLIGINTWKLVGESSDHVEGINFAIPSDVVLEAFASYLKEK